MESLPTEAVCNICSFLDVNSSVQLSLVSDFYEGCVSEYVKIHRSKFVKCLREINAIEYHIGNADLINHSYTGKTTIIEHNPEKEYSYRKVGEYARVSVEWNYCHTTDNTYDTGNCLTITYFKERVYSEGTSVADFLPYNYASYWKIFKKYDDSLQHGITLFENDWVYETYNNGMNSAVFGNSDVDRPDSDVDEVVFGNSDDDADEVVFGNSGGGVNWGPFDDLSNYVDINDVNRRELRRSI